MHSYYLSTIFDRDLLRKKIVEAAKTLKGVEFDAIAVRGVSGLTFGSILSYKLKSGLVVVRKSLEGSHADTSLEVSSGLPGDFKYIIVDDLTSSGETIREIKDRVGQQYSRTQLVGAYFYLGSTSKARWCPGFNIEEIQDCYYEHGRNRGD